MRIACPELSKISRIRHGFFTRKGGVSHGIYASLNCGYGSGDDIEKVATNRARIAESLGQSGDINTVYQIHSGKAVIIKEAWAWEDAPEADALVTASPGIVIGVLSADCLPILLADGENGVVAAAHAGWKGALGGIIESTLEAMASLGSQKNAITASLGPCIAQASYEVGAEFRDRFLAESPDNQIYFLHGRDGAHYLFDLASYAKDRLKNAGISRINLLAQDTCLQENDFFSYRRACLHGEAAYGRQVSAIVLE